MYKNSFADRLSLKVILLTSAIFLISVSVITIRGTLITYNSAMRYSEQSLLNSSNIIESTILSVEQIATSMAWTIEAFEHNGDQLDTARYYPLLEEMFSRSPYILGCGMFYEPYAYTKNSKYAGIYLSRNLETGEMDVEWDDDRTFKLDGWDYFTEDWYAKAVESGKSLWIPPFFEYMVTGEYEYITSYAVPVMGKDGKIIGVCAFDMSLEWLQETLLSMRPYNSSDIFILDQEGNYICDPLSDTPFEGNLYESEILKDKGLSGNVLTSVKWRDENGVKILDSKRTDFFCVGCELYNGWIMVISSMYNEAFHQVIMIWIIMSTIIIIGIIILYFTSRRTIHKEAYPLVEYAKAAGRITDGHFDVPIPKVKNEDEIGKLGDTLRYMQESVTNYIDVLKVTTSEKERLAGELNVSHKIQEHMLSTDFPKFEGGGFYASSVPARQVGGDLYDFYVNGDELFFVIGDVSGKGVPAALMMAISIAAFRAAIRNKHTMDEIVSIINRVFCRSNDDMMFITLIVGKINTRTGEMEVCNAGHNPMVLAGPDGNASFVHLKNNLACGVFEGFAYTAENITISKGSRLIIYTDGVTEAENSVHEQYGEDRLLEFARNHSKSVAGSESEVVNELTSSVNAFVDGAEQFDDITMVSISI